MMKKGKWQIFSLVFAVASGGPAVGSSVGEPLDVTIQGQAKDQIIIERVSPEPEVALKDVIPFSRLGQTDWILSEEMEYVDEDRQVAMMDVNSPKTYRPSMIEFPKPPFFIMAYPPPPVPILVDRSENAAPLPGEQETWTFIVVDQNNTLLRKIEGTVAPVDPLQWDGWSRGEFMLRTDEIYSSILVIQETPEVSRTIVGDPIWLPALRYIKGNNIVFEFSNKRVYNEGYASFSPALRVLVDQLMNELKKNEGSPFDITIFDKDLELGQKRANEWKKLLEANLLRDAESFHVRVSMPKNRGQITQIVLGFTK